MLKLLFSLFIAVPIAEIVVLVQVGSMVGLAATLALILLTALLGAVLVRRQGLARLQQMQAALSCGQLPAEALYHAGCLLFAGALLLTPGFLTDTFGFVLLSPWVRERAAKWLLQRWLGQGHRGGSFAADGTALDAEFHEVATPSGDELPPRLDKRS